MNANVLPETCPCCRRGIDLVLAADGQVEEIRGCQCREWNDLHGDVELYDTRLREAVGDVVPSDFRDGDYLYEAMRERELAG